MISFHARVAMQRNNAAFALAMCLAVVAAARGRCNYCACAQVS